MSSRVGFPQGQNFDGRDEYLEHIRKGTREQYESGWVEIRATLSKEFQHGLGEIPWAITVLRSESGDGKYATLAPSSDYTITYGNSDGDKGTLPDYVTVTNDSTDTNYYFKVRAL